MYKCGFCGSEYSEAKGYQNCVVVCCKKYEQKKAEEERGIKEANLKARTKELRDAQAVYEKLRDKFIEDYPSETITEKIGGVSFTYLGKSQNELLKLFPELKYKWYM